MIPANFIPPRRKPRPISPLSEIACLIWEIFGFAPSVN